MPRWDFAIARIIGRCALPEMDRLELLNPGSFAASHRRAAQ